MIIKLSCLACGHLMVLGDAYADYNGEVRCWGCRAILEVALKDGKLQAMKTMKDLVEPLPLPAQPPPTDFKRPGRTVGRETR